MRYVSKTLVLAALLAAGVLSSGVRANDLMIGSFTLPHPIEWKGTTLPAGNYTLKMVHTQSDARLLTVRGSNKALDVLVFAQSACETCKGSALNLNSDNRVVNSLDLPGYHVDFTSGWSKAQREQARKAPASEQIAVQVNQN